MKKWFKKEWYWVKVSIVAILGIPLMALCGCSTTTITETAYNPDGSVQSQKITETNENAIVVLSRDIGKNNLAIKQGGFFGSIGVNAQTQSYGIQGGSVDNSLIMSQDSENGVNFAASLPPAWNAQKYSLEISKDGIKSASGVSDETDKEKSGTVEASEEDETE